MPGSRLRAALFAALLLPACGAFAQQLPKSAELFKEAQQVDGKCWGSRDAECRQAMQLYADAYEQSGKDKVGVRNRYIVLTRWAISARLRSESLQDRKMLQEAHDVVAAPVAAALDLANEGAGAFVVMDVSPAMAQLAIVRRRLNKPEAQADIEMIHKLEDLLWQEQAKKRPELEASIRRSSAFLETAEAKIAVELGTDAWLRSRDDESAWRKQAEQAADSLRRAIRLVQNNEPFYEVPTGFGTEDNLVRFAKLHQLLGRVEGRRGNEKAGDRSTYIAVVTACAYRMDADPRHKVWRTFAGEICGDINSGIDEVKFYRENKDANPPVLMERTKQQFESYYIATYEERMKAVREAYQQLRKQQGK